MAKEMSPSSSGIILNSLGESVELHACRDNRKNIWRKNIIATLAKMVLAAQQDMKVLKDKSFVVCCSAGQTVERAGARQLMYLPGEISMIKFSFPKGISAIFNSFPHVGLLTDPKDVVIEKDAIESHLSLLSEDIPYDMNGGILLERLMAFCTENGSFLPIFTAEEHMDRLCTFLYDLKDKYGHGKRFAQPLHIITVPNFDNRQAKSLRKNEMDQASSLEIFDDMEHEPYNKGECSLQIWPVELLESALSVFTEKGSDSLSEIETKIIQNVTVVHNILSTHKMPLSSPGSGACDTHTQFDSRCSCALKKLTVDLYNLFLTLICLGSPLLNYNIIPADIRPYCESRVDKVFDEQEYNDIPAIDNAHTSWGTQGHHTHNYEPTATMSLECPANKIKVPSFYDAF